MNQTAFELLNARDLLPAAPTPRKLAEVAIEDIEYDDVGPAPTADLIKSIRQRGVQNPIALLDTDGMFLLISGRRRIRASIICGFTTIPAIIHTEIEPDSAALTDHALRHKNPAGELRSIERLLDADHSEQQIAAATGLPVGTIRARLKLQGLPPVLRTAFDAGSIGLQTAEQVVKLAPVDRELLAHDYLKYGALTTKDVKERRRVQRSQSVASLPLEDEATDTPAPTAEGSSVKRATLDDYLAITGTDQSSVSAMAYVGITCVDTGRLDDAKEVYLRIIELVGAK